MNKHVLRSYLMKKVNNNSMPSNFGATMSFNLKKKHKKKKYKISKISKN